MNTKWMWILFVWHEWRRAVWEAEMCLYPEETFGNIISTPLRRRYAETLARFHGNRAGDLHRKLFPPPPMTKELMRKMLERRGGL